MLREDEIVKKIDDIKVSGNRKRVRPKRNRKKNGQRLFGKI